MSRSLITFLAVGLIIPHLESVAAETEDEKGEKEIRGLQLQRLDEPALPNDPVKPRTAEEDVRLNAQAWHMTGRLFHQREKYTQAQKAYEKAVELDPTSVHSYRALIEIALHLRQTQKAIDYALKAIEIDPDDFQLLRQVGIEMARGGKPDQAIRYLEQALKSPKVNRKSGFFVLLNRDLGIIYVGMGETEKAADRYEIVLDALLNPEKFGLDARTRDELQKHRATSWEQIGTVLLAAKRVDAAQQALEQAVTAGNGKPGRANYLLAQLYHHNEKEEDALQQIELFFTSAAPKNRKAFHLFGEILKKLDQSDSLISRIEKLVEDHPDESAMKLFLAETYIDAERLDDAEKIYRTSIDDKPSSEAYLGLARIYRRQNKARELLLNLGQALGRTRELAGIADQFEKELKAIEKDEQLLNALILAGKKETESGVNARQYAMVFMLGRLAAQVKRVDEAVEFFELSLKANPAQAATVYQAYGQTLLDSERYVEAARVYRDAADNALAQRAKPDNLLRLALALELSGETDQALEAVGEAGKIVPGHPLIEYRIAWVNYHARRFEQAIKLFEEFIGKHPKSTLARQAKFSLSAVYVQQGEIKKGEEILERFLTENPDDPGVNNDLGYLYADQGKNLEKAKTMIEKAIKAEPENAAYLDSMGWVLFKLGEFKEATTWLKKATDLEGGGDSTIWDHLGDCHHKLNAIEDARKAWTKAVKAAKEDAKPDQEFIKKVEEKLKIHESETGKDGTESKKDS